MNLSSDLISEFVKVTSDKEKKPTESTVYGTVVKYGDALYVKIDGSDLLTPMASTADIKDGERVTVMIKDHTATITGNITSPSASKDDVEEINNKVVSQGNDITLISNDITSMNNTITQQNNTIKQQNNKITEIGNTIDSQNNKITEIGNTVDSQNNTITEIDNEVTSQGNKINALGITVDAQDTSIKAINTNLESVNSSVKVIDSSFQMTDGVVTGIKGIDTDWIKTKDLETDHATIGSLDTKYANIDFANIDQLAVKKIFADSGIIKDLVVSEGHITGELVGVTIKGDLIEGGTVVADKLVVLGNDGLYYKLNTDGVSTTSEQTEYNSLNGSVITAKTITAEKVNVNDLVAFGATIGGFNITDDAIYSGVKESVANTTSGIFLGKDGQVAFGDGTNHFKYYKDESGKYILDISASRLILSSSGKNVEDSITSVEDNVNNIQIGGRNLLLNTNGEFVSGTDAYYGYWNLAKDTYSHGIKMVAGQEYTLSFEWSVDWGEVTPIMSVIASVGYGTNPGDFTKDIASERVTLNTADTSGKFSMTFTPIESELEVSPYFAMRPIRTSQQDALDGTVWTIHGLKLEKGNKVTDWTPAPEDMATSDELDYAQSSVEERVTGAETQIRQLEESLEFLVTDGNGGSLMKQTENGWTFNIGNIQDDLNDTSDKLDDLSEGVNTANATINNLGSLLNDLSAKTAYITMTTDDDNNPCIELGKEDNPFKVRITNTAVEFIENSSKIAYVQNHALQIEKAVINNELLIGNESGFLWKRRSNGNLGLQYVQGGDD